MQPKPVTNLLCDLVALPSENPRIQGARADSDESGVADYVEKYLSGWGLEVERQVVESGRYNLVARLARGPEGPEGSVLLSAHMDTYPADQASAIAPRNDGVRIWGRGSADAKGSLAAMVAAFVRASASPRRRAAVMVASVDEEHGLSGARTLAQSDVRADLAITGEPTSLVPILAQNGILRFRLTIEGPVYHAAYPVKHNCLSGVAALLEAASDFEMSPPKPSGPLSTATVSPINVTSNGEMNAPATSADIWFDVRFPPGIDDAEFLSSFVKHVSSSLPLDVRLTAYEPSFVSPPNNCEPEASLVGELVGIIADVTGSCSPEAFSYGSEAGHLSKISHSSLVLGPGDARLAHHPDESIEVAELEQAETIFSRLLVAN